MQPIIHCCQLLPSPANNQIYGKYLRDLVFNDYSEVFDEKVVKAKLEALPAEKRFNLFYCTAYAAANAQGKKRRSGDSQDIIFFDIDGLGGDEIHKDAEKVFNIVTSEAGWDRTKTACVFSGNGIQVIAQLTTPWIPSKKFFNDHRLAYKMIANKIHDKLLSESISFDKVDTSVFSASRVMRLPCTENRKPITDPFGPNVKVKLSHVMHGTLIPQEWEWPAVDRVFKEQSFGKIDDDFVLDNCEFIKHAIRNPETIHEPEGYALMGVLAFLPGRKQFTIDLFSEFSASQSLQSANLELKYEQAQKASGPRTCEDIATRWDGCPTCKFYKKCKTPLQLKAKNFIATEDSGFTTTKILKNGNQRVVRHYNDLVKFLKREYNYKSFPEHKSLYFYQEGKYNLLPKEVVRCLIQKAFQDGGADTLNYKELTEAYNSVSTDPAFSVGDFPLPQEGVVNFPNGVYNYRTKELMNHSPDYNFQFVLPYPIHLDGSPPPIYMKILMKIFRHKAELINLFHAYLGYILSYAPYDHQIAMIMAGAGQNGKTTLINLIAEMLGQDQSSFVKGSDLEKDRFTIPDLEGKLANIADDEGQGVFENTSMFKHLTGGAPVRGRKAYDPTSKVFKSRAKMVMSYNNVPKIEDCSTGLLRRLLIIPFTYNLDKDPEAIRDPQIGDKLIEAIPWIYKYALDAYLEVEKSGTFPRPDLVVEKARETLWDNQPAEVWWDHEVTLTEGIGSVSFAQIFNAFKASEHCTKIGKKNFNIWLKGKLERLGKTYYREAGRLTVAGVKLKQLSFGGHK